MALVEVRFEPSRKVIWVRPGSTLLEAAAAAGVDVATGCRRGLCGTDALRVTGGASGLAAPTGDEQGTLERMGLPEGFRLSCSAVVERGPIIVDVHAF